MISNTDTQPVPATPAPPPPRRRRPGLGFYAWLIVKNIIGWTLILTAPLLGLTLPVPAGLPLFFIGFGMITFPGKRKLTARVLRGKPLDPRSRTVLTWRVILCPIFPFIATLAIPKNSSIRAYWPQHAIMSYIGAVALSWLLIRGGIGLWNTILRLVPPMRRKVRPWLRRHGIDLLPPRRRRRTPRHTEQAPDDDSGIVTIDGRYERGARQVWRTVLSWAQRIASPAIILTIFGFMLWPLYKNWPQVHTRIAQTSIPRFLLAAVMFAFFLFAFRALSWRRILRAFGFTLPIPASVRIWSTSELARYIPGAIWQVWGRVYLVRPYGVSGSICSTTQILELCIFLMANVLVATSCLLWFGAKIDPAARPWFFTAMALVPALALLLHPKVFYGIANRILQRLGKPIIVQRFRGRALIKMLAWFILGLLWQSLAVWVITSPLLGLKLAWWWIVAGAYCLAWCAGFLAVFAPGGLGVREGVFVATMQVILRQQPQINTNLSPENLGAFLVFLSILLRLWTITGELILTGLAYLLDDRIIPPNLSPTPNRTVSA